MMTRQRVVMGHPTLNANVRAAAAALADAGALAEFHTLIDTSKFSSRVPARLAAQIGRRETPESVRPFVRSHPSFEVARLLARRLLHSPILDKRFVDVVYSRLDAALARAIHPGISAVYSYEDGAMRAFARAEQLGIRRVYDLPTGYWRAAREIFREEAELQPGWAGTVTALQDGQRKLEAKDSELATASTVLVASDFTRRTLEAYPGELPELRVVPYGAPAPVARIREATSDSVRVLFVGRVSQQKGASYFFDALDLCDVPVEVTVIGMRTGFSDQRDRGLQRPGLTWHPSLPHAEVLALMEEHDVLVFPSVFDGFGLVITEALSRGLPVITTPNTAGPDLLRDGVDGWIVPIRSAEAIAARISALADVDRRNEAKYAALESAGRHTWSAYGEGILRAVSSS